MERFLTILLTLLIGGCTTSSHPNPREDVCGITVDYLGRRWPQGYEHYSIPPDRIPEFVVRTEMKKVTIDAGVNNDDVVMASSFSPLFAVRNMPVLLPENFRTLLVKVLEENRPYMNEISWPFAPASHAYILMAQDLSSLISLTRYDNAFVIQHAFFASSPFEKGSVPYEFQSLGAWATWVESPELARFLDETFEVADPQQSPFSKWVFDSTIEVKSNEVESMP